jgi:putative membrane protein
MTFATLVLGVSAVDPYDRATWTLEVAPVIVGIAVLALTYPRLELTRLVYRLLFLHALVLIVGGYYTYARVPAGFWVAEWLDLGRNHYDRFGHFFQGFAPAILIRELLLRLTVLGPGVLTWLVVTSMCLAFSALYELVEWWTAVLAADGAVEFLGTQGDPWDAQWDMFLALIGALTAQLALGRLHDRGLSARAG